VGNPHFSIVIPTYKRPRQLNKCLRGIVQIDYPKEDFEVIVVDDGSGEAPMNLVEIYHSYFSLRLIQQPHAGPATARNRGAEEASGGYIVFTDDDCVPERGWLSAFGRHFEARPEDAIGGRTINALEDNVCSAASQLLIDYLYDYYNIRNAQPLFFASNNLAVPRKLFLEIGGFDRGFPAAAGEDRELCDRWVHSGHGMSFASDAVVFHSHSLTFRQFVRQHFNYGRGAFQYHRLRALRRSERIRLEPVSFYSGMLTFPFTQRRRRPVSTAFLLTVSQAANAAGFFSEKRKSKR
jgi:GT2 family glycosyltransferase